MDQQAKQGLQKFVGAIIDRKSRLTCVNTGNHLTDNEIIAKVEHSQLNVFEERCINSNRRKAVWTFDRKAGKASLNRLYQSKNAQDTFSRKR